MPLGDKHAGQWRDGQSTSWQLGLEERNDGQQAQMVTEDYTLIGKPNVPVLITTDANAVEVSPADKTHGARAILNPGTRDLWLGYTADVDINGDNEGVFLARQTGYWLVSERNRGSVFIRCAPGEAHSPGNSNRVLVVHLW